MPAMRPLTMPATDEAGSACKAESGMADAASALSSARRLPIGHVAITALTADAALATLHDALRQGGTSSFLKLAFANAHFVNEAARNAFFRRAVADFLVLPDGIGVDIAARLLHGAPFPANLNGTDFIPRLLAESPRPLRLALVGARPGVAARAAAKLAGLGPGHAVVACFDGYFDAPGETQILSALEAAQPDLLLVALGNPRQEIWIAERLDARHARIAAGVGALFDFLAGEVPRAPRLVRALRCEWLYRLAQEPARLWRRYILGNPLFLARVLRQKLTGAP